MEVAIFIIVVVLLLAIAVSPAWLMWLLAAKGLPSKFAMPPNRMAFACVLLSLATAALLNLELEGGALSAPIFVLAFSVLWSAFLIPLCVVAKYLLGARNAEKNT